MDQIISEVMIGQLVEKEIKHKEAGGKMCEKCGVRYTDPSVFRGVRRCYVCLEEHNKKEVIQMLNRMGY